MKGRFVFSTEDLRQAFQFLTQPLTWIAPMLLRYSFLQTDLTPQPLPV